MGAITSGDTVTARAYLTEMGRKYLFQDENNPRFVELSDGTKIDRLKIERFSLGDPDINYKLPDRLQSGEIPDLSGENENNITGAKGRTLNCLVSPSESVLGTGDDTLEYITSQENIVIDLNKDLSKIPTVITQELITLLNDEPTLESTYELMPKNFGENVVKDNQLVINLREATTTRPGYRMRIFYPTIEDDHNKVTIQFERATVKTTSLKTYKQIASQISNAELGSK
jgi:hypothetical protein